MRHVAVIGSGGAGKSTLARRLGEITGLPVVHLDREFWRPGWTKPPKSEWTAKVEALVEKEEWIMDGNFGGTMEIRLTAADTVLFLDFPRLVCTFRALKRFASYRNRIRPDMAPGCFEKLDLEFLSWVWNFPEVTKPRIEKRLATLDKDVSIVRLSSPSSVEELLGEIERVNGSKKKPVHHQYRPFPTRH